MAGDCSYRPEEGSDEWCRIRRKRDEIAAKKQPAPQPASPTDEVERLLALLHEIETLLKSLGMLASNGANYGSTNTERLRLLASIDRALGAGGAT